MIRIPCPFCGERDHSEFGYGGDGSIVYPALDAPAEDWLQAVFQRENLRGRQSETWQHVSGCRMWLVVERDTMTHEIYGVRPAHAGMAQALEGGTQKGGAKGSSAKRGSAKKIAAKTGTTKRSGTKRGGT